MKTTYKKYQIVGNYSFSETPDNEYVYGFDTYEEAVAAASESGSRTQSYIVEIKSTVKQIVRPVDVTVEEFQ